MKISFEAGSLDSLKQHGKSIPYAYLLFLEEMGQNDNGLPEQEWDGEAEVNIDSVLFLKLTEEENPPAYRFDGQLFSGSFVWNSVETLQDTRQGGVKELYFGLYRRQRRLAGAQGTTRLPKEKVLLFAFLPISLRRDGRILFQPFQKSICSYFP